MLVFTRGKRNGGKNFKAVQADKECHMGLMTWFTRLRELHESWSPALR